MSLIPDVIEVGIAGPQGPPGAAGSQGPQGPQGPAGSGSGGGGFYRHTQNTPDTIWSVTHNLGYRPAVAVEDSGGNTHVGTVTYISADSLTIEFTSAFSGFADLS